MAQPGRAGHFDLPGNYGMTLRVYWSELYDVETNQSTVGISAVQVISSQWQNYTYYISGSIAVNGYGTAVSMNGGSSGHSTYVSYLNDISAPFNDTTRGYVAGASGAVGGITHDADGRKDIYISVSVRGYTNDPNDPAYGWAVSGTSAPIALTPIPRKSTLSAQNGVLGVSQKLTVTKQADIFDHTITYSCGNVSGMVCERAIDTIIDWTPNIDLALQNKTGVSVPITLTITTYNGDSIVGTNSVTITCDIPASVAPSCSLSISDAEGYDSYGAMIKGCSKMNIAVSAETSYGADIVTYQVVADGVTYNTENIVTDVLKSAGIITVTATVVDQRGRSATASQDITVLDYAPPVITLLKVKRCDVNDKGVVTDNENGEYCQVTFSGIVTPLENKNSATYMLEYKRSSDASYPTDPKPVLTNEYSVSDATYIFHADSGSSFDVRLTITDNFAHDVRSVPVSTGVTIMHWKANGRGMGIGKMSEKDNTLDMGWAIRMNGNRVTGLPDPVDDGDAVSKRSLIDLVYPVNSIYISYGHVSPAVLFGGTWERIKDAFLFGIDERGAIGETGGEKTHVLTEAEMPSHSHNIVQQVDVDPSQGNVANIASGSPHVMYYRTDDSRTTLSTGGGNAHNNMPPYVNVSIWRRTA
jgi:hypothetical protein